MTHRHLQLDTFYRFALGAFIFVLVLAMYAGTSDPTIHVKDLLIAWAGGLLAGTYVVAAWLWGKPLKRPPVFFDVLLCLLGFLFVATLFSDFFRYSLLETGQFFSLFAIYWVASQVYRTPAQVFGFFMAFCSAVFIAGLYAVIQKAGLDPFPWGDTTSDTYTNLPATFGNPNYAAHAIILALIMVTCLVRSGATWAGWIFVPVLLFHLHSTDQRAGWIALAGAGTLAGLGWLLMRKARRPVLATGGVLAIFAALALLAAAGTMVLTHARTGSVFPLDLSLLLRYQSYVSATNMIFDAPAIGHGPAVYGLAYPPYWTPFEQEWFAQEGLMNEHVHNDLLELAIDGGLAAAGLYLALLVLGMCHGLLLVARGTTPGHRLLGYTFAGFFCAFAIDGLFGFNLRVPVTAALFFVMMGILDGLWRGDPVPATPTPDRRGLMRGAAPRAVFVALLVLVTWQESRRFAAEYFYYHGTRAQHRARFNDADAHFQKAAALAPWNWNITRRLGTLELERQRPERALAAFERSLEQNPHHFLTHLPMARANLVLAQAAVSGDTPEPERATALLDTARAHAGEVLSLCPTFPVANDLLGRIESIAAVINRDKSENPDAAVQASHWRRARVHFQKAIDRGADNTGDLYRMLVQVEASVGNLGGAEQALKDALRVDPGAEQSWSLFLTFARENDRFVAFRDTIFRQIDRLQAEATPESDAELATAYRWLAVVFEEGFGDLDSAEDALVRATRHGPEQAALWSYFAAFARKHGRMQALEAGIRAVTEALATEDRALLPQVAAVHAVLDDPASHLDEASRILLAGVRSHPADAALSAAAAFGWPARRLQEAYDTLVAGGAAPCESALNLGIIAASLDDLPQANARFEHAMACLTDDCRAFAAVHWADTLSRTGQEERALALLQESASSFPGHIETRWSIARTLARLNRTDEARTAYEELLEDGELTPQGREQIQGELAQLPSR